MNYVQIYSFFLTITSNTEFNLAIHIGIVR